MIHGSYIVYPKPYAISIDENSIRIGGLLLDDKFIDECYRDICAHFDHKKHYQKYYEKEELANDNQINYREHHRIINLKRNELLTYENQIEIVDKLLEDNNSFLNKLFGKKN